MIIFGTRSVKSTLGQGNFHCPRCRNQRPYRHIRVRRFFTLYFIPLIPLDVLGEFIECGMCTSTWDKKVLAYNPEAERKAFAAEFERAMKRTLVLMSLADGAADASEVECIRDVYGKLADVQLSEAEVHAEIEAARADGRGVHQFLSGMAGNLNDKGKEMVVKGALFVATADGQVSDAELKLLTEIAQALGMSSTHLQGILQAV